MIFFNFEGIGAVECTTPDIVEQLLAKFAKDYLAQIADELAEAAAAEAKAAEKLAAAEEEYCGSSSSSSLSEERMFGSDSSESDTRTASLTGQLTPATRVNKASIAQLQPQKRASPPAETKRRACPNVLRGRASKAEF